MTDAERIRELEQEVERLQGWIRAAYRDAFLCRPRLVVESFRDEVGRLTEELRCVSLDRDSWRKQSRENKVAQVAAEAEVERLKQRAVYAETHAKDAQFDADRLRVAELASRRQKEAAEARCKTLEEALKLAESWLSISANPKFNSIREVVDAARQEQKEQGR